MKNKTKNLTIDSHAHLNFKAFNYDLGEVIKRNLENNVWVINAGSNYKTSQKAVEIAQKYEKGVYASVGLHPIHTVREFIKNKDEDNYEEMFNYEQYKELAKLKKVVAIGETGLDYYYKPKNKLKLLDFKEKQRKIFVKHFDLARELDLPLIFHCRMAHNDLKFEIQNYEKKMNYKLRGVVHCFTGTLKDAQDYLNIGLYLGFTGIIFKMNLKETIEKIPLDRILIETDCPYLIPPEAIEKFDCSNRNEPLFVKYIAEEIAHIRKISINEIIEITTQNAKNLFKI